MTKPESKKDQRPLFQVIYDLFGYSPGGGLREVGTILFDGDEKPVKAYFVTIKPQPQDPNFQAKVAALRGIIHSNTIACRVVIGVEIIGEQNDLTTP